MTGVHDTDPVLRTLDAATHQLSPTQSHRARTDLQRILATDPAMPVSPRPQRSRKTRRVALIGGMVAAVTAAVVILPSATGGDQAFASWTATPIGVSGQEEAAAAEDCRDSQEGVGGGQYIEDLSEAETAIAERRGVWTTVILTGPDGFSTLCITDNTFNLFGKGMIGSVGKPTGYTAPGPRELQATSLGTGTMSAGDISLAAGNAGTDVVGVAYASPTLGEVTATVAKGHFALWLPGDDLRNASDGLDVTVTYRDGTTGTITLSL